MLGGRQYLTELRSEIRWIDVAHPTLDFQEIAQAPDAVIAVGHDGIAWNVFRIVMRWVRVQARHLYPMYLISII